MKYDVCVVFGGTGFIGSHFALSLLEQGLARKVILADIALPRLDFDLSDSSIEYVRIDVRTSPSTWGLPPNVDLIANFAAIHREPGHDLYEYYETNLPGAENVCKFAEASSCRNIIFTSSIAPYGPTESVKTEESIPAPISGYGGSKLAAEKIHLAWQLSEAGRKLVIVRPGVVFGPGEGGNVTRLVQATLRRYFLYMGNRSTRKAGGYVKELINTMFWALHHLPERGENILYNFTVPVPPTVEQYVKAVCSVAGVTRFIPSVPYWLLLSLSYVVDCLARPLGISQPVSPVRVRKLVRSNNIAPSVLVSKGYQYKYDLNSAMADWRRDRPDEWA